MSSGSTISFSIPELLAGKVKISSPYQNLSQRGAVLSYGIDLSLPELNVSRTVKSRDLYLLPGKVEETLRVWESKYQAFLDKKARAELFGNISELNKEAQTALEELNGILAHTLSVHDAVDWDAIKRKDTFRIKREDLLGGTNDVTFLIVGKDGRPTGLQEKETPEEPMLEIVRAEYGLLSRIFFAKRIQADFEDRLAEWKRLAAEIKEENLARAATYSDATKAFEKKKAAFEDEKKRDNEALADIKLRYNEVDPKAIEEYCDLVLSQSKYVDYFPRNWSLEYTPESKILVVDYDLPAPVSLPQVESYKYVKVQGEIAAKPLSEAAQAKLFDSVAFQICIRTIHELFEADVINVIGAVVFNGLVTQVSPATGVKETKTILSVSANKEQFLQFDLSRVDPKATFKHLKGVAARTLMDLAAIPPVMRLNKTDKRFIEGRAVDIDESVNLAAMDWEDFEHLVRELFEKEFASSGGEVKVTRPSADGGVDAIAFDPDPIRGGKIVIQAKRYTNVVGVAAVRDLYGTVVNEGATKGILVTTSDYGKDSYEFAKDKPLTLLNGSNLLSLLERHGRKAKIDIAEARKLLKT